jgi:chromosome segregation ATPase
LIDTPGFDDTYKSDTDILREVANWLREAYENKIELTGIIYLHRILDVRLGGSAMKNLRMFKKLCGDEGLASVVLATTMWNNVEEPTALQREHQLMTKPAFWAGMIAKGSRVFRQDQEAESAMEIVNYLIARKRPVILDIQRQMVEENMTLDQTGAGAEVQAEIARQKAIYEKKLDEIKEEMRDAMKAKDKEAQEELAALREEIQEKIRKDEEDKIKLQADKDELRRQMDEQFAEERRTWMGKIEEIQANARRDQENRDKLQAEKDALRTKLEEQREKQNKDYYNALHENQTRIAQNQQQVEMMRLQHEKDLQIQRINFRLEQQAKESREWQKRYEEEQSSCVVM